MAKKIAKSKNDGCDCDCSCCNATSKGKMIKWHVTQKCSGIYGLGFLGAAIYYISTASGFWMGVLGLLKAIVWPAFLIFEMLKFVGA